MSDTAVDLAQLRQRLAKLGVHITEEDDVPNLNSARPANPRVGPKVNWESHLDRNSKEVAQLLDRCNKVHQALCNTHEHDVEAQLATSPIASQRQSSAAAVLAAKTAVAAKLSKSSPKRAGGSKPTCNRSADPNSAQANLRSPSTPAAGAPAGSSKLLVRAAQKLLQNAQAEAQQVDKALASAKGPATSYRTAASSAANDHRNSPLGSVLAQFKEAQAAWAQEKAKLRREAVASRKKASKLELDLAKLQRLHQHKTLDVNSLKAALKGRDQTLEEAHGKVRQLEEALVRSSEVAAEKLCAIAAERDDLQALLLATLERLEGVETVVAAADATSAAMEEKVRVLEGERMAAFEAAAAARADVAQLKIEQKRLQWQRQLLEQMSEVQLRHNKRKSAAIKELLTHAPAGEVDDRPCNGCTASGRGSHRHQSTDVLQDVLDELLQQSGDGSDGSGID